MASWLWNRIVVFVIRYICMDPLHHNLYCIYLKHWHYYESNVAATRLWHRSNGLFVGIVVSHSKQTTLGALGQTNMAPGTNAHPMPADGRFPVDPSRQVSLA